MTVYALKNGVLQIAYFLPNNTKYVSCPEGGHGVKIGCRCHGWRISRVRPADRKVRPLLPA